MTQNSKPIYRFAPSPNGELHLGHAYSALLNLKLARENNGTCLLRIEDIDTTRCTPALEKQMLEDLEWIGFEWDTKPRRQSEYFDEYRELLDPLLEAQLVYPATLSRSQIKAMIAEKTANGDEWLKDPEGVSHYPGTERSYSQEEQLKILTSAEPYNLRLDMQKAIATVHADLRWVENNQTQKSTINANPWEWGDIILARKDTPASYSLCCVHDDFQQGITHVVRGKDLYNATSIHVLLQSVLKLPQPEYFHHSLILDENGNKLSKSIKSAGIRAMRNAGYDPKHVRERLFGLEL